MSHLRCFGIAATAFAALFQVSPAAAREPTILQPSSSWNLDYAEDKCALKRIFTDGEDELQLQIEQSGLAPYYNIALFGEAVDSTRGELIQIQFGPSEEPTRRSFIYGDLEESDTPFLLMHGIHLAPATDDIKRGEFVVVDIGPEREAAITNLTLSRGLRRPIRLELGSMGEPLAAMRTCVEDLVTSLKMDEEGLAEVVTGPVSSNPEELARFIQARYPARMLRNREGGSVFVQ